MILLNLSEIIVVTPSLHRTLCKSDLYKTPKAIVIASSWSIWAIKIEKITSVNIFWGRSFSCENFRGVCRLAFSHALYVLSLKPSQNLPLEILKSAKSAGGGHWPGNQAYYDTALSAWPGVGRGWLPRFISLSLAKLSVDVWYKYRYEIYTGSWYSYSGQYWCYSGHWPCQLKKLSPESPSSCLHFLSLILSPNYLPSLPVLFILGL